MNYLPVKDAATALGVSERTVWRRIKHNQILSRKENGRALVCVDGLTQPDRSLNGDGHPATVPDLANVERVLTVITQQMTAMLTGHRSETQRAGRYRIASWTLTAGLITLLGYSWVHMGSLHHEHAAQLGDLQSTHHVALDRMRSEGNVSRMEVANARGREQTLYHEIHLLREEVERYKISLARAQHARGRTPTPAAHTTAVHLASDSPVP